MPNFPLLIEPNQPINKPLIALLPQVLNSEPRPPHNTHRHPCRPKLCPHHCAPVHLHSQHWSTTTKPSLPRNELNAHGQELYIACVHSALSTHTRIRNRGRSSARRKSRSLKLLRCGTRFLSSLQKEKLEFPTRYAAVLRKLVHCTGSYIPTQTVHRPKANPKQTSPARFRPREQSVRRTPR